MKCEKCRTQEASLSLGLPADGHRIENQLCLSCVSKLRWLSPLDLYNLGFPTQPSWDELNKEIAGLMDEVVHRFLRNLEAAKRPKTVANLALIDWQKRFEEFRRTNTLWRLSFHDVDFLTLFVPDQNWKVSDPPQWSIQLGYEEERLWWKRQTEARRMVLYGPAIEGPHLGAVMVGWLCPTLEEAQLLASSSPWIAKGVTRVLKSASAKAT